MQNVVYIEDSRADKIYNDLAGPSLQWSLDSLGNNLMAMLWLAKLAHMEMQNSDNLELARKYLENALKAGDSARKLLRAVLNSQEPHEI